MCFLSLHIRMQHHDVKRALAAVLFDRPRQLWYCPICRGSVPMCTKDACPANIFIAATGGVLIPSAQRERTFLVDRFEQTKQAPVGKRSQPAVFTVVVFLV